MRARAAWAALGFAIIGGCCIYPELAFTGSTGPEPTEPCFVTSPHEVVPDEAAIVPKLELIADQQALVGGGHWYYKFSDIPERRQFWIRLKDKVWQKWHDEAVRWRFGKLLADRCAEPEFYRKRFAASQIAENQSIHPSAEFLLLVANLAYVEADRTDCDLDNRKLTSDCGASAEHCGVSGCLCCSDPSISSLIGI